MKNNTWVYMAVKIRNMKTPAYGTVSDHTDVVTTIAYLGMRIPIDTVKLDCTENVRTLEHL